MSDHVSEITDQNFETSVAQSDKPVLINFWATWCGPCLALAPAVESLAAEMSDTLKVGKLDIDSNQETCMKFGVRSIPTLILFKDGQPVDQIVGNQGKDKIKEMVERHM